jgi:ribulose-phosphate 3-epimerase
MTVNPGFGGQRFIESVLPKIGKARDLIDRIAPGVILEVDGGITPENIGRVSAAGAEVFVAGAAVFGGSDYGEKIRLLKQSAG